MYILYGDQSQLHRLQSDSRTSINFIIQYVIQSEKKVFSYVRLVRYFFSFEQKMMTGRHTYCTIYCLRALHEGFCA